ncbi:MAG: N-acetylmuramoyl-L-alanine amidase [Clostridia bacterium]|nr:N-acetylmuramoyl-L-alanine amidase [Clostridia bacterium]
MKVFKKKGRPLLPVARVLLCFLAFLCLGLVPIALSRALAAVAPVSAAATTVPVVILDAGHGGEDGGAVGVNGALEKDLNLAVAQGVAALLREKGVAVILTREEDRLLYREEENVKGHRKEYDLKNRLAVAKEHPEALFVSIHMNTFSSPRYSGLQVYYAGTEGSAALAEAIQTAVREGLQPENTRRIHAASSSIYLLENAVGRAVLVECGFLSNPAECERLSEKDYQSQLCFSIFCGIMEYIEATRG